MHINKKKLRYVRFGLVLVWLGLVFIPLGVWANPIETSESCCEQLNEIEHSILQVGKRQQALVKTLEQIQDPVEKAELLAQVEQLKTQHQNLQGLFEKIAFGGVSTQSFRTHETVDERYNWQDELLQIVRPLFSEMRKLTEKPRVRDKLHQDNIKISEQLIELEKGLEFLATIPRMELDKAALKRLDDIAQRWRVYEKDLQSTKNINNIQLKELEGKKLSTWARIKAALVAIFLGRGLILLLAFSVLFAIIFVFNNGLNYLIKQRKNKKRTRKAHTQLRFLLVIYRVIVYVVAFLGFLSVLYAKGDMVLFGLAFMILIMVVLSLRNYAPRYMNELKLFLNLGTVREGERVIFNGLPWRVQKIGFYCILVNPLLDNGMLRIPLSNLPGMNSRPIKKDELWFPTKVGDSVLLPNAEFGVVVRQTPESVYLDAFTSEIIYPAAAFANATVKNLTAGYIIAPVFGLDYHHSQLAVDDVISAFEPAIRTRLEGAGMTGMIIDISVQFKRIVYGISIEYALIMTISGEGASYYYMADRLANLACLEVCQQQGWHLPKNQIALEKSI